MASAHKASVLFLLVALLVAVPEIAAAETVNGRRITAVRETLAMGAEEVRVLETVLPKGLRRHVLVLHSTMERISFPEVSLVSAIVSINGTIATTVTLGCDTRVCLQSKSRFLDLENFPALEGVPLEIEIRVHSVGPSLTTVSFIAELVRK